MEIHKKDKKRDFSHSLAAVSVLVLLDALVRATFDSLSLVSSRYRRVNEILGITRCWVEGLIVRRLNGQGK
ncbi:MAG: hypothetical protein B7Y25_08440, partial [Alphaproteobacteria bacterium 16-39-46]